MSIRTSSFVTVISVTACLPHLVKTSPGLFYHGGTTASEVSKGLAPGSNEAVHKRGHDAVGARVTSLGQPGAHRSRGNFQNQGETWVSLELASATVRVVTPVGPQPRERTF